MAELVSKSETLKKTVRAYRKNRVIPFGIMVVGLSITRWSPCSAVMIPGGTDRFRAVGDLLLGWELRFNAAPIR